MAEIARRGLALAAVVATALIASGPVRSDTHYAPAPVINVPLPLLAPEVDISYGQSWRALDWPSIGLYGINAQHETLLAFHTVNTGAANGFVPGPLPNSAGISLPTAPDGITGYGTANTITVGRAAALAEQLLRLRAGKALNPILEFCPAYPSSSWNIGGGGGLKPGSTPWTNMLTLIAAEQSLLPARPGPTQNLAAGKFRAVAWTQGGSLDTNSDSDASLTSADFTSMEAAFDALSLPGTSTRPLQFFLGLRAGLSTDTNLSTSVRYKAIYDFVRANANGRTNGTTPWYQWPFAGPSDAGYANIHTGPYGSIRHGEIEGYAKYVVYDEGAGHYAPLWRSLTKSIALVNGAIVVPFDRPSGADFASSALGWMTDPQDGIAQANQYGWVVKVGGTSVPVTPTISGLNVLLTPTTPGAFTSGQTIEVSYAWYGPGGTNPGLNSGVYGNLMMAGPPSVFFSGKTINAWAWQFAEMITL